MQAINYRDAHLHVAKLPSGWKVFIYLPGCTSAHSDMPTASNVEELQAVIGEAKSLVDKLLGLHWQCDDAL